ncbi:hypothetical protein B0H14DRAFT_2732555 [Mycena olivaceomarginata]|nr:hypothetical protein B0H14DRAFT_2732555 [Mycena olivaceomarginata]
MSSPSSSEASFILVGGDRDSTPTPAQPRNPKTAASHPSADPKYTPGRVPSYAHDWSQQGTGGGLRTHGRALRRCVRARVHLRGSESLGGACKTPANDDNATFPAGHQPSTFRGACPSRFEEAPEHLARPKLRWGAGRLSRFLVTWEATRARGAVQAIVYDTSYLTYLRASPHAPPYVRLRRLRIDAPDVWVALLSGGSGAPAWDARGWLVHLQEVGESDGDADTERENGAAWLRACAAGGTRRARAVAVTCFWAGSTFTPKLLLRDPRTGKDVPVQEFLQTAFLDAWAVLVKAVGDLEGVCGFRWVSLPLPFALRPFDATS